MAAFDEVTFDHHTAEDTGALGDLFGEVGGDQRLAAMVLRAVAVRAIDNEARGDASLL